MNDINQELLDLNSEIIDLINQLAVFKPRFYHSLNSGKLNIFLKAINTFRLKLIDLDKRIKPHTRIPENYNSIQMVSGKLAITFSIRNQTLISLNEAQKYLNSHDDKSNFKLTIIIAFAAILLSAISVAFG